MRGVDLLGDQAEIVGVASRAVSKSRSARSTSPALARRGHEPERADHESALLTGQAVGVEALIVSIAQHQAVLGQVGGDRPRSWPAFARRRRAGSREWASAAAPRRVRRSRMTARKRLVPPHQPRSSIGCSDLVARGGPLLGLGVLAETRARVCTARSSAVQHSTLEERWWRGSPRISHIPWSRSRQRAAAVSARSATKAWISRCSAPSCSR